MTDEAPTSSGESPADDRPKSAPPTAPRLSIPNTLLWAIAWAALMVHGWGGLIGGDSASWLGDPAGAAQRVSNRDIELANAAEASTGWIAPLRGLLHAGVDESLDESIAIHRDLVDLLVETSDGTAASSNQLTRTGIQLAILLAEAGSLDEGVVFAARYGNEELWAAGLSAVYDEGPALEVTGAFLSGLTVIGLEDWMLEQPGIRVLRSAGADPDADALEAAGLERGRRWLRRTEALMTLNWLLIVGGSVILLVPLLRGAPGAWSRADGAPTPPWSLQDGIGVLLRGDFWSRLYLVALGEASRDFQQSPVGSLLYELSTPIAAIPLLWLTWHHLIRPLDRSGVGWWDAFGVRPARWAHVRAAGIALAAVAAELLGTSLLGWGSLMLGFEGEWAEGFDEVLTFGSAAEVLRACVDYVAWAPLVEELTFRGILYFSLRSRLGAWQAAALSAGVFSLVHFYSLPGFLTTFWSGAVWAMAFERARSIVPGITAHAVYNLLYVLAWVSIYR